MKSYHCCATCRHIRIERAHGRVRVHCSRLGYDTKTHYQFNCWDPRADIREKMDADRKEE